MNISPPVAAEGVRGVDARGSGAAPVAPLAWRVIRDGPGSGIDNMALDHALAVGLGPTEAVLRLYSWERPTVSLGRNEPARGLYSTEEAARLGVHFVRRPTGGRAVLHDAELTYAVVAPVRAWGGVREAYRLINEALAQALAGLGAPVTLAGDNGTPALDTGPCFLSPAGGEVTARGRKLVGSAQCRIEGALLQHGSIILDGDQQLLGRLTVGEGQAPVEDHPAPATLSGLVGEVSKADVADSVTQAMRGAFAGEWVEGEYTADELAVAVRLAAERYGSTEWTWRR